MTLLDWIKANDTARICYPDGQEATAKEVGVRLFAALDQIVVESDGILWMQGTGRRRIGEVMRDEKT